MPSKAVQSLSVKEKHTLGNPQPGTKKQLSSSPVAPLNDISWNFPFSIHFLIWDLNSPRSKLAKIYFSGVRLGPGCCKNAHSRQFWTIPTPTELGAAVRPRAPKTDFPGSPGGAGRVSRIARSDRFAVKRPLGISMGAHCERPTAILKMAPRASAIVGAT